MKLRNYFWTGVILGFFYTMSMPLKHHYPDALSTQMASAALAGLFIAPIVGLIAVCLGFSLQKVAKWVPLRPQKD